MIITRNARIFLSNLIFYLYLLSFCVWSFSLFSYIFAMCFCDESGIKSVFVFFLDLGDKNVEQGDEVDEFTKRMVYYC